MNRFRSFFSLHNDNILGKEYRINYSYDVEREDVQASPIMKLKRLGMTLGLVPLILIFSAFAMFPKLRIVVYILSAIVLFFVFKWLLKYLRWFVIKIRHFLYPNRDWRPYEGELQLFIENNNFDYFFPISYIETDTQVIVKILKDGGKYQAVAVSSDEKLAAVLNLELSSKKDDLNCVTYFFNKYPVQRKEVSEISLTQSRKINIYDDLNLDVSSVYNSLISGVTGSGKTYYLYFLLGKFASQVVSRKIGSEIYDIRPILYVIDAKRSDLYKHMRNSGIADNYYGTDIKDSFRIVREFMKILEYRQKLFDDLDAYDKNLIDLNYEPCLLVIDEYPSLVAMMDKKQKDEFEAMLGNIARLGRSLSMGLWVVMQQANANTLGTDVKEQLVNRFFMGSPSQQSAQMMFGVSSTDLPRIEGKGVGIAGIEGKEPVKFLSPTFTVNSNELLHPILESWAENRQFINEIELDLEKSAS